MPVLDFTTLQRRCNSNSQRLVSNQKRNISRNSKNIPIISQSLSAKRYTQKKCIHEQEILNYKLKMSQKKDPFIPDTKHSELKFDSSTSDNRSSASANFTKIAHDRCNTSGEPDSNNIAPENHKQQERLSNNISHDYLPVTIQERQNLYNNTYPSNQEDPENDSDVPEEDDTENKTMCCNSDPSRVNYKIVKRGQTQDRETRIRLQKEQRLACSTSPTDSTRKELPRHSKELKKNSSSSAFMISPITRAVDEYVPSSLSSFQSQCQLFVKEERNEKEPVMDLITKYAPGSTRTACDSPSILFSYSHSSFDLSSFQLSPCQPYDHFLSYDSLLEEEEGDNRCCSKSRSCTTLTQAINVSQDAHYSGQCWDRSQNVHSKQNDNQELFSSQFKHGNTNSHQRIGKTKITKTSLENVEPNSKAKFRSPKCTHEATDVHETNKFSFTNKANFEEPKMSSHNNSSALSEPVLLNSTKFTTDGFNKFVSKVISEKKRQRNFLRSTANEGLFRKLLNFVTFGAGRLDPLLNNSSVSSIEIVPGQTFDEHIIDSQSSGRTNLSDIRDDYSNCSTSFSEGNSQTECEIPNLDSPESPQHFCAVYTNCTDFTNNIKYTFARILQNEPRRYSFYHYLRKPNLKDISNLVTRISNDS